MNASKNLLDISVAEARKLEKINCNFTSNFADGELDGENNFEPIAYQWFNSDYRQGYLRGMAKRIDRQARIHGIKAKNVVSIY